MPPFILHISRSPVIKKKYYTSALERSVFLVLWGYVCCDRIAAVLFTIAVVDYGNRGHENPTCPLPQVDRDSILSFSVALSIYSFKFGYSYSLLFVSIHVIIDHHTTTAIIRLPCHYAWMIGLSQPAAEPNPCKQKPLHVCRTLQYINYRVGRRDTLISSPDDSHVVTIIRPSWSGKVPACGTRCC